MPLNRKTFYIFPPWEERCAFLLRDFIHRRVGLERVSRQCSVYPSAKPMFRFLYDVVIAHPSYASFLSLFLAERRKKRRGRRRKVVNMNKWIVEVYEIESEDPWRTHFVKKRVFNGYHEARSFF